MNSSATITNKKDGLRSKNRNIYHRFDRLASQHEIETIKQRAIARAQSEDKARWEFVQAEIIKRFNLTFTVDNPKPSTVLTRLIRRFVGRYGQRVGAGENAQWVYLKDDPESDSLFEAITLARKPENERSVEPLMFAGTASLKTPWLILDIDKGSPYQQSANWRRLEAFLKALRVRFTRYRSSYTEINPVTGKPGLKSGWHIYIFFNQPTDSEHAVSTFQQALISNGFTVKPGTLEIYPTFNHLIRLPLQEGFKELGVPGRPFHSQDIKHFLYKMIEESNNLHSIIESINQYTTESVKPLTVPTVQPPNTTPNQSVQPSNASVQPCTNAPTLSPTVKPSTVFIPQKHSLYKTKGVIQENIDEAKAFFKTGLTMTGTAHYIIMCLSHYYWYTIGSDNERRFKQIMNVLRRKHNGNSTTINKGRMKTLEKEVWNCVSWRPPEYRGIDQEFTPFKGFTVAADDPDQLTKFQRANIKRANQAQMKIIQAVNKLQQLGQKIIFSTVQKLSQCGKATISRYKSLWHKTDGSSQYIGRGLVDVVGFQGSNGQQFDSGECLNSQQSQDLQSLEFGVRVDTIEPAHQTPVSDQSTTRVNHSISRSGETVQDKIVNRLKHLNCYSRLVSRYRCNSS